MEKEILSNSINEKIKQLLPAKDVLAELLDIFEKDNLQNHLGNRQDRQAYENIWNAFKCIRDLQNFELS